MSPMSQRIFHYPDGNVVKEGDLVQTGNTPTAVVVTVIQPGTDDAEAFNCPSGGILIEESWGGTPSLTTMEPPDGIMWEDLVFIDRRK